MRVPALFLLLSTAAAMVAHAADTASVPAGLISHHPPRFPAELRGVKAGDGEVVMAMTVDAQGRVDDSIALEATHDAFVQATAAAVKDWRFLPVAGDTWPRRVVMQFSFRRSGVVTTLSHAEAAQAGFVSTSAATVRTMQWHELDAEPQRIAARMPALSKSALARLANQPLMINFVIDRQGQVRVPVVTAAEDAELAQAVLDAVRQWRYSPPMHQGGAVAVEATRVLRLSAIPAE